MSLRSLSFHGLTVRQLKWYCRDLLSKEGKNFDNFCAIVFDGGVDKYRFDHDCLTEREEIYVKSTLMYVMGLCLY